MRLSQLRERKVEDEEDEEEEEEMLLYSGAGGGDVKGMRRVAVASSQGEYQRKLTLHIVTSFLLVANIAATINYLYFKIGLYRREYHQVLHNPWLFLVLLCELAYFISSVIAAVDHLIPPNSRPDLLLDTRHYPTVHIFLPCCKEPTDIPKDSIRAALALHYPKDRFKVLVLDDGGDDDLRAFCEALQVESGGQLIYLRRQKVPGVAHHFKCGNLNYGLEHSNAEYVVMMDADMILHPSFLRRLLPYIVDSPEVSFVQVPQSFYNLPPGDPLNDSCMMGYERTLVHRDSLGTATCIGTGALFRRKHLNVIGGFQPHSITEDTTTAYALFNQGFKSVYLNLKLQIGLNPWTLEGYIRQRQRWGLGAIQQFAGTWRSMLGLKSNLSIVQQVLYFWHTGYYYLSILNIILLVVLFSALAFRLNLTVGGPDDNRRLISYLAVSLLLWRLAWTSLWLAVPQSVLSRNRDESHFWWMTPFFFKMVMQSVFAWSSTFSFVPTSNIDRAAGGKASTSAWMKRLRQLKHVKFHICYAAVVLLTVCLRVFWTLSKYGWADCRESFFVLGLSVFLINTAAHMLLPVMFLLTPAKLKPSQRKSLLRYDAHGVPRFTPGEHLPKWHWSIYVYEGLSYCSLLFWAAVLYTINTGLDMDYCDGGSF